MGRRRRRGDVCRILNESAQKLNVACFASLSIRRLRTCTDRGSCYINKRFWKMRTFVGVLFGFCYFIMPVCDTHVNYIDRPQADSIAWCWYYCEIVSEYWYTGRAVCSVGLRPFGCWDCGFESRRRHGCLSLVSVVCCQVEVSVTGRSLVQGSPTECAVCVCDCAWSGGTITLYIYNEWVEEFRLKEIHSMLINRLLNV
jgi:hypothetical protein